MTPAQLIALARRLADLDAAGAAESRSATSRAYLTVREFVESGVGVSCKHKTVSDHKMLQRMLIHCGLDEAAEIGRLLDILHEARKVADYEMDDLDCESKEEAQLNMGRANEILVRLKTCEPLATWLKLKAGMLQYRKAVQ